MQEIPGSIASVPVAPTGVDSDMATRAVSVSELTAWVKKQLESGVTSVWVRGEITNLRPAASGHLYFSLKDSDAVMACAFFGWGRRKD